MVGPTHPVFCSGNPVHNINGNGATISNGYIEMLFLPKTTGSWSGNSKTYRSH